MKTKQLLHRSLLTAFVAAAMTFSNSSVFAQVKIGTNPTTINTANNLEVEASSGNKVSINKATGKVTIADGSQGDGKILTSDANGVATWQPAPGVTTIVGTFNPPAFSFVTPPATAFTPDCPITLNKGTYTLFYYAQFDYYQAGSTTAGRLPDPSNSTNLWLTWPRWIYFEFTTISGAAMFPSYRYETSGLNDGPFVIPTISAYQVGAKISQLVVVTQDNTVIKPRYFSIPSYGRVSNIGPIVAVKM